MIEPCRQQFQFLLRDRLPGQHQPVEGPGQSEPEQEEHNAPASILVQEMGGIVGNVVYELDCDRVQVTGMANDNNDRMQVQCNLKGCEIPAGLTEGQIQSAFECMDNAEKSGGLGKSVQTRKLNNQNLLNGKIKSKGIANWQ